MIARSPFTRPAAKPALVERPRSIVHRLFACEHPPRVTLALGLVLGLSLGLLLLVGSPPRTSDAAPSAEIEQSPSIRIDPDTLRFRATEGWQQPLDLKLMNEGDTPETFTFLPVDRLLVSTSTGTLSPGDTIRVVIRFASGTLKAPYSDSVVLPLQLSSGTLEIPVFREVVDGEIKLEPGSFTMDHRPGAPADTVHITLRNAGSLHTTGIIHATPTVGVSVPEDRRTFDLAPGAAVDVPMVIAPPAETEPGDYEGYIAAEPTEYYGGTLATFRLHVIGDPPRITTAPAAVTFHRQVGDPPETLTLRVGNKGFERLVGQAWATPAWLEVGWYYFNADPHSPSFEWIAADPTGLPAGTYTDVITLDSNDPLSPRITVPVTMIITEPVVPVAPVGLAIRQVGVSSFGLGDSAQFVELRIPAGANVLASHFITLQATDHSGALVLEGADLFAGLADGTPLPEGRSWLLAGADFLAATGLAPDRLLPLHLDPLGGVLTLLDAAVEPPAILQRFGYGAAGGVEAPAPGGALQLGGNRIMQSVAVATPANSAGASLPALPAICPVDTLEAGALRSTSRAAGDALESTGPGAAFQRVTFDKAANVFRVSSRDGAARLVVSETFAITGLRAGEELALDAVLWTGHSVTPHSPDSARAHVRWGLRAPGTAGVSRDRNYPAETGPNQPGPPQIRLPLLHRAGEIFTLELELSAEALGAEAEAQATLDFFLLPNGVHVVSCGGLVPRPIVPIALAAPLVTADPDRVRLEWRGATGIRAAQLQRRQEESAWRALATLAPDTDGRIVYEDRTVEAGGHYAYRLVVDGEATPAVAVDVPRAAIPRLTLRAPARVAGGRRIPLSLEVPADGPVALELFDVQGRRVAHGHTAPLSIGHQDVTWDVGTLPAAGLYFLRALQAGQGAVARTLILR